MTEAYARMIKPNLLTTAELQTQLKAYERGRVSIGLTKLGDADFERVIVGLKRPFQRGDFDRYLLTSTESLSEILRSKGLSLDEIENLLQICRGVERLNLAADFLIS